MSEAPDEFQKIRIAIEAACDILANAIERHGGGSWDYMIVAVPVNRGFKEVGLMSSVAPEQISGFLAFLLHQYQHCSATGRVIDDRTPPGKPS